MCIAKAPQIANAYVHLGCCQRELGKYEEALELFQKAICLDAKYCFTHFESARLYFSLKDFERTIAEINVFFSLGPRKIDPTVEAEALLREAKEAFRKQLENNIQVEISQFFNIRSKICVEI
jgi:tetratricopeptide (TPR) repeat protein